MMNHIWDYIATITSPVSSTTFILLVKYYLVRKWSITITQNIQKVHRALLLACDTASIQQRISRVLERSALLLVPDSLLAAYDSYRVGLET